LRFFTKTVPSTSDPDLSALNSFQKQFFNYYKKQRRNSSKNFQNPGTAFLNFGKISFHDDDSDFEAIKQIPEFPVRESSIVEICLEEAGKCLEDGRKYLEEGRKYSKEGRKYLKVGKIYLEEGGNYSEEGKKYLELGRKTLDLGRKYSETGRHSLRLRRKYLKDIRKYLEETGKCLNEVRKSPDLSGKTKKPRKSKLNAYAVVVNEFMTNADAYLHFSNNVLFEINNTSQFVSLIVLNVNSNGTVTGVMLIIIKGIRSIIFYSNFIVSVRVFDGVIDRYCGVPP